MKTYFMAWESDKKAGHCMYDFKDHIPPREAIKTMVAFVHADNPDVEGQVRAIQFNRVE